MKNFLPLFFLFCSWTFFSQESSIPKLGQTSIDELLLTTYDQDSSAVALVLYEKGNYFLHKTQKYTHVSEYYHRVKILTSEGLEKGTIKVGFLSDEKIFDIQAHSWFLDADGNIKKNFITEENIINNDVGENSKEVIINIPNVRVGSVIEYSYKISSPYFFIRDWNFQTDIPKIRSDFKTLIEDERKYHTRLIGVDTTRYHNKENVTQCYSGSTQRKKRCVSNVYRIDTIKAFHQEVLMVSPENVMTQLKFHLTLMVDDYGRMLYSSIFNWREFDRKFQLFSNSNQKENTRFYKRKLPNDILKVKDTLERAKHIYYFIQDHYVWNRYLGGSLTKNIRKKFKNKEGSVNLINSSLYNSLNSQGIECKYVLLSTRGNGTPDKKYPNLEDYNYMIVQATIDGEDYLLDATEKNMSFGTLPLRTLNDQARIMDFDKGSYWQKIQPKEASTKNSTIKLAFDDEMNLTGTISIEKYGMDAYMSRTGYKEFGKDVYLEGLEEGMKKLEIESFEVKNTDELEKHFVEHHTVFMDSEDVNSMVDSENVIRFSPVFFDQLSVNPFKSNTRNYDLDFLYQRKNIYRLSIEIPKGYKVSKLPKNQELALPKNGGTYVYRVQSVENTINLYVKFFIKKNQYSVEEYANLKRLYEQIVKAEDAFVELQKIEE